MNIGKIKIIGICLSILTYGVSHANSYECRDQIEFGNQTIELYSENDRTYDSSTQKFLTNIRIPSSKEYNLKTCSYVVRKRDQNPPMILETAEDYCSALNNHLHVTGTAWRFDADFIRGTWEGECGVTFFNSSDDIVNILIVVK